MALPFIPQPLIELKNRFKASLTVAYSARRVMAEDSQRPGESRDHVFDFEDGIRLIVSRDYLDDREVIHVSGSYSPDVYKGPEDMIMMIRMQSHFCDLYGPVDFPMPLFSSGGVPHWLIPISNLN